jgi:nondiscriminating glutamyl-tRNA synthetase
MVSQIKKLEEELDRLDEWEVEKIKIALNFTCVNNEIKKEFYLSIREVLTGKKSGPELSLVIFFLGKEEVKKRLRF